MPLNITETQFDAMVRAARCTQLAHAGIEGHGADLRLPQACGRVKYSRTVWEGRLTAVLAQFELRDDLEVALSGGKDILVTFVLDGGISGTCRDARKSIDFRVRCALMRLPSDTPGEVIRVPADRHNAFVQLRIDPDYFRRWLSDLGISFPNASLHDLRARDGRVLHNSVWTIPTDTCLRQIAHSNLPQPVFLPYLNAKALELLTLFTHEVSQRATGARTLPADRLARAEEIIASELSSRLTIDELARRLDWNPTDFKSAFRKRFGMPVGSFVRDARLKRAAELLARTKISIYSVARESGWECQSRFGQAFQARYGMTPSGYRARHIEA